MCFWISLTQILYLTLYYHPSLLDIRSPSRLFRKTCNFFNDRDSKKAIKLFDHFVNNMNNNGSIGHYDIFEALSQIRDLNIFSFEYISTYKCKKCKINKQTTENMTILSIHPTGEKNENLELQELLSNYLKKETIKDAKCEKCDTFEMKKFQKIENLPEMLFVQFVCHQYNRTNEKLGKNESKIKCKLKEKIFGQNYELVAVSQQNFFSDKIGHYISFVNYNNHFFEINDESIKPISESEFLNSSGYAFIFKKIKAESLPSCHIDLYPNKLTTSK